MAKLTLSDVSNISGQETSAINTLNANSALIETALENTLSRDGTSPNTMNADLDMNTYDVMNVGNVECDTLTVGGVTLSATSAYATGPQGPTGATGPQGPAGAGSGDMLKANNLSDVSDAATAFSNIKQAATTSATGVLEIATQSEALAGSPSNLAVTSDVLKAVIDIICPVGMIAAFHQTTAPTNWLICDGTTIGSATSGATGRANADTSTLFTTIWNSTSNTDVIIQTSTGVNATRGASAAADFAADKRIPLPNLVNYFIRGKSASRGIGNLQAESLGPHTHTFTTGSSGSHQHGVTAQHSHGANGSGTPEYWSNGDTTAGSGTRQTDTAGSHQHTGTTDSSGGTETRPANYAYLYCIKY